MLGTELGMKSPSRENQREPPEPLLAEMAEPLGYLKIEIREVELLEINALETTSTVRFLLTSDGVELLVTNEKAAAKQIIWENAYRVVINSYQGQLEFHLVRTSQDLLTNQLTRKTLGACPFDWLTTAIIERGEGGSDDCAALFKGKKKPIGKMNMGWQYRAAPNPYGELDSLLLAPDQAVLQGILRTKVQYDGLAGALMRYFAYNMKALKLFELALQAEIESTTQLPQLFRDSSITNSIMSEFLALHGDSFLKDILRPLVHKVLMKAPDLELDPAKIKRDDKEQKSAEKKLAELCMVFLKGIATQMGNCPPAIREVCNFVQVEVEKKFPGKSQVALAGLLFLRFICPAIVITDKVCPTLECPPQARRALLLVTKVLQSLANDVQFGNDKEAYMIPMNAFLEANKTYANEIYKKVMKADKKGYDAHRYRRRVPGKVYETLFAFTCEHKLLTPAQIEATRVAVARDLQPPAAVTNTSLFHAGKTPSSDRLPHTHDLHGANRTHSEGMMISKSSSPELPAAAYSSTPEVTPSPSKEGTQSGNISQSASRDDSADMPGTPMKTMSDSQVHHDLSASNSNSPKSDRRKKEKEEKEKQKSGKKYSLAATTPLL